jgi:hypothetical protein
MRGSPRQIRCDDGLNPNTPTAPEEPSVSILFQPHDERLRRNDVVRVVPERPRWRRYPSLVYRWAAGSYVVAAAGVWWFALRDGESGLAMLLAFVVLLGAAVVSAFKALPVGFIRFGDAPGPP